MASVLIPCDSLMTSLVWATAACLGGGAGLCPLGILQRLTRRVQGSKGGGRSGRGAPEGSRSWLGAIQAVPFITRAWGWGRGAAHQSVFDVPVVSVAGLIDDGLQAQGVGVAHHRLAGAQDEKHTQMSWASKHVGVPLGALIHWGPPCTFTLKTVLALQRRGSSNPQMRPTSSTPQLWLLSPVLQTVWRFRPGPSVWPGVPSQALVLVAGLCPMALL